MKKNDFIHRTIIALCLHPAFPNITRGAQIEYAQLLADDTEKAVPFDDTSSEAEEKPADYGYLKDLLDCDLRDFNLKVRTVNALSANNIKTVRDLVKLHKTDVLALRNVSRHALWELEDLITNKGLRWGMEV